MQVTAYLTVCSIYDRTCSRHEHVWFLMLLVTCKRDVERAAEKEAGKRRGWMEWERLSLAWFHARVTGNLVWSRINAHWNRPRLLCVKIVCVFVESLCVCVVWSVRQETTDSYSIFCGNLDFTGIPCASLLFLFLSSLVCVSFFILTVHPKIK